MKDQLFQPEASLSTTPTDKRATTPSPLPSVATPSTLPLKNTAAPSAQTISPSKTAETVILPQTVPQPAEKVFFSLDDALAFRDHLMTGANCREDLEKVIQIYPRTPLLTRVIETTEPFCISPQTSAGPLDDLIESFLRAKRQARLAYYHATHAVGLAYLKALGTAFVEIRNLNADDTTPLGIFDRAETALEQHNLRRALTEIHKLSPVYQAYFADFKSGADAYLAAQKNLNALVLSFGKKED